MTPASAGAEAPRSEDLFRGGFEHSPIGMVLTTPEGVIEQANLAFTRMLGYEQPDDLAGSTFAAVTHADDLAEMIGVAVAIGGEVSPGPTEQRFTGRDGRVLDVLLASSVVRDGDGRPVALFTQVEDITERRRAEDRIRELNATLEQRVLQRTSELQAANHELEAFAYSLAHDLRAPLRAIDGFGAALHRRCGEALGEDGRALLDRMRTASSRMGDLIDSMLLLSELTRRELTFTRIDLTAIARGIADELRAASPGRQVEFLLQEGLDAFADAGLVRILLGNLLENAWKFTEHREQATVSFARASAGVFAVSDNGAGFNMEFADLLFKPFARLHREDEFPGNGVGLTTAERIALRHGGVLWGEGQPGAGATFYFTLDPADEED
jgi:PAS domain S-box-containing protein